MVTIGPVIKTLDALREYVEAIICEHNQLELGAYRLTQRVLSQSGRPCGMYFCLHGPRAVRFSAIWETEQDRILLYGATGERVAQIRLSHSPPLERAAA